MSNQTETQIMKDDDKSDAVGDVGETKIKRGKRFSHIETDLLLSLVMSSNNTNSMETNRKDRLMGWRKITKSFNASPGVVSFEQQRTEKELRQRISNVRKDLYKLAKFQNESCLANKYGGRYSPQKPPKISFEFTKVVKSYAISLQVKLAELTSLDSKQTSHLSVDETPPTPTKLNFLNKIETSEVVQTPASSEMFGTQSQNRPRRKRNNYGDGFSVDSNSSTSMGNSFNTNTSSAAFYEKKAQLLADENKRRNEENERRKEWHNCCMDIKKEELTMRRKQTEFWSILIKNVTHNSVANISEIANLAKAMETANPITYDNIYPSGPTFSGSQQYEDTDLDVKYLQPNANDMPGAGVEAEDIQVDYESIPSPSYLSVKEEI